MQSLSFEIEAECPWSKARAGTFKTPHGEVQTPVFMPVGTQSTVKAMTWDQVEAAGSQIVLANSYHLYLRPGHNLVAEAGGLHGFSSWKKPILTDSGGFQVFSLEELRKISEDGVSFKDHVSGQEHFIGPAKSMEIQNALGADIIMAFDECVKNPATHQEARAAMERTHRWLEICIKEHKRESEQALFGIVQGSIYEDLRDESLKAVSSFDLPAYAIGGVAVGEERSLIEKIVAYTAPKMPANKPRYLMGVGTPWDILYAIYCGIDMFDCVLPTRLARHGAAFTSEGRVSLRNARFRKDWQPLEADCRCFTCSRHTRAYLHHLVHMKEMTASTLLSIHNIHFLHQESKACRLAILEGRFQEYFQAKKQLLNSKAEQEERV
ncbi:MAG: tRNA guanosine(34) transglycosylase Tgt [Candidatus Obscuribacterales bacterium]|nr:tRNA guanosine(34) transglycosylase Tgt [Candidatus Obscuribacterales bacterium]